MTHSERGEMRERRMDVKESLERSSQVPVQNISSRWRRGMERFEESLEARVDLPEPQGPRIVMRWTGIVESRN